MIREAERVLSRQSSATVSVSPALRRKKRAATMAAEEEVGGRIRIWAWDHLHVGRSTSVGAIADMADCPLGCRWTNAGGLRFGANVRTTDIEFYKDELDQQRASQMLLYMCYRHSVYRVVRFGDRGRH
ncbi:uncharacterized protein LOC109718922 isoform X1 [Ananas comosus]|uniref:Uncharacterized protein LOC109718922 isoform X1 n=1 Tax=Ananas comosus TaxID=4615 RepID=A0A6P5FXC2_ANACO|nr:uncharacterized protein LOC109718922 isoform X1 [Ananas comosus]